MAKEKGVKDLEDLPGIGPTTAEKPSTRLRFNQRKMATASPHELAELTGMKLEAAKQAVDAAKQANHASVQDRI